MVATYKSLRGLIVVVAFTFLAILLVYRNYGDDTLQRHSISAYYHNQGSLFGLVPVRDLFVAMFCGIALLLYAYKGYNDTDQQNRASFEREGGATRASERDVLGSARMGGAARHAVQSAE
jgi:preprotein translocase subunit SecG